MIRESSVPADGPLRDACFFSKASAKLNQIFFFAKIIFHLFFQMLISSALTPKRLLCFFARTPWSLLQSGCKDNALFPAFPNKKSNKNQIKL
jgi:hypothetical protein